MPFAVAALSLILLAVTASALATAWGDDGPAGGRMDAPSDSGLHASRSGLVDTDLSGVPDALQNLLYGTDPSRWNTSGSPLPDGWLIQHGYDALDPNIDRRAAAVPPLDALPETYDNQWPLRFTPTLWDVYSYGRPADWSEATMGPFRNGIDPRQWDNSGDGIPDGWLLAYGLDPLQDVATTELAGPTGLTVRQAFQHDTDPRALDSDGDGLNDRDEIEGPLDPADPLTRFPPTDPARSSTAGTGVCDGYLVAHGLDPNDPASSYGDPALSGASTKQRFEWSREALGDTACRTGAGLDPNKQSTTDGPIPDGWLLHHGLDPLDPELHAQATQSSQDHAEGPWAQWTTPPDDQSEDLEEVVLTVLAEYQHGRPTDWQEASRGPWWGGTDPGKIDTDGDGMPDSVELRGFYITVATDVGPAAALRPAHAVSDPTSANMDGDGLTDLEEVVEHQTDPGRRDSDLDGIQDHVELAREFGLDPMRADTAGDFLRDGERLRFLKDRARAYHDDATYHVPGEPGVQRSVLDWACAMPGAKALIGDVGDSADCSELLAPTDLLALFGPAGNLNGRTDDKGAQIPNVLDADIDGDTLLNGWETEPRLHRHSQFGTPLERSETDPLNPDTDGDGLADDWETQHGRPLYDRARYSLDPSRWASLCDVGGACTSDAEQDPDEDRAVWPRIEAGADGPRLSLGTFDFPNLQEQQFDREPHEFSSDGDGLGDGWKAFWGVTYPATLASEADRPTLGMHRPAGDVIPPSAPRPAAGVDQADVVVQKGHVVRFLLEEPVAGPGETVERFDDVPLGDDSVGTLYKVTTPVEMTFADAQAAGTNPYLMSTVGDGVPDWWKWHYRNLPPEVPEWADCVDRGLDILDPALAGKSLTGSGLTIEQEYRLGTNPLCTSTMYLPVADGVMAGLGEEAVLDPSRARFLLQQQVDSDGDGIYDFEELIGEVHDHLGSHRIQSDPEDPDSDGDGLLDGHDVVLQLGDDDARIRLFLDMGLSYRRTGQEYTFKGEISHGTHPRNGDDTGTGVPAGWLVSNGIPLGSAGQGDHDSRYSYGKPPWWDERAHGPWWGGLPASTSNSALQGFRSNPDRDLDGLLDVDAQGAPFEDPMPGANRENVWRVPDRVRYPPSPALPGLAMEAVHDEQASRVVRALLAQAYVTPRHVGDQYVHLPPREAMTAPSGVQPCIQGVRLVDGGTEVHGFLKGRTIHVEGVLTDACRSATGTRFAGVTVEARFGSPSQSFGAAFTDAAGRFRIPVNITSAQRVDVAPGTTPLVLRGATDGTVEWTADPSIVRPGARFLELRTYAAPAAAGRDAVSSWTESVRFRVDATAVLHLDAPEDAQTGKTFEVAFQLVDSGGAPLRDHVRFTWSGQERTVRPDPLGAGSVLLDAYHSDAGIQTVWAESQPTDGFVTPATATAQVILRKPVLVDLGPLPSRADAGDTVHAAGTVHFQKSGVEGIPVRLDLTGPRDLQGIEVASSAGGGFAGSFRLPADLPAGEYVLVARAMQTDATVAREASEVIGVRSIPRFTAVSAHNITQGEAAAVAGVLRKPDGHPIGGAQVSVRLHGAEQQALTDARGRFAVEFAGDLPAYPVLQVVVFEGDDEHTRSVHRSERAVLAPTRLAVPGGELARGADLALPVRLLDADGRPIMGAGLWFTWGGEEPVLVITNGTGHAMFRRDGHASDALGTVHAAAVYPGSRDGGHLLSVAAATWTVRTKAELVLPAGGYEAGTGIPQAVLRDAGTGEPLRRMPVAYKVDPGGEHAVATDDEGRFAVLDGINRTSAPRHFAIHARFPGNASYNAVEATSTVIIQTPVELVADVPPRVVAGRQAVITVIVEGLDGARVPDGTVTVRTDDAEAGAAPVEGGQARIPVIVPESTPSGNVRIQFQFHGSDSYAPALHEAQTHVLRGVELHIHVASALAGGTTTVEVTATSAGRPVAFAPIHLDIQGIEGGLRATTDENGIATYRILQPVDERLMAARFVGEGDLNPAHTTATLVPAQPASTFETGASVLAWVALGTALVMVALASMAYRMRRNPLEPVFRRARRIIGAGGRNERQILQAYRELEEAAIGQGMLLETAQTPRVLQEALDPAIPAAARGSLGRLIRLFEIARYSTEPMQDAHGEEAAHSLRHIIRCMRQEAGLAWPRPRQREAAA